MAENIVQEIEVDLTKNPSVTVKCEGLVLCSYKFSFIQPGNAFLKIEDGNMKDRNHPKIKDIDPNWASDKYKLSECLKDRDGFVKMRWYVEIASTQSQGDIYDFSISYQEEGGAANILARYTQDDPGHKLYREEDHSVNFIVI